MKTTCRPTLRITFPLNSLSRLTLMRTKPTLTTWSTLSGVAKDSTSLGTFTGTTIADSSTIKAAIQALETELESTAGGGGAEASSLGTVTRSTDAAHYLTFVQDDNASITQETFHTDAGVVYNPSSNLLTVGSDGFW